MRTLEELNVRFVAPPNVYPTDFLTRHITAENVSGAVVFYEPHWHSGKPRQCLTLTDFSVDGEKFYGKAVFAGEARHLLLDTLLSNAAAQVEIEPRLNDLGRLQFHIRRLLIPENGDATG